MKTPSQTADNIRRDSFACGNVSLLAPHFRIFPWRLSVPCRIAPRAASRLARTLLRPTRNQTNATELTGTSQILVYRGDVNCLRENIISITIHTKVHPKYSGWCRHLYSICGSAKHRWMVGLSYLVSQRVKVAHSWVGVGSFHTHLFGVVCFAIFSVREFLDTPS
jgi:hypothetical protein